MVNSLSLAFIPFSTVQRSKFYKNLHHISKYQGFRNFKPRYKLTIKKYFKIQRISIRYFKLFFLSVLFCDPIKFNYSEISIKRTFYKAEISLRRTVYLGTDVFRVKLLWKNLYKSDYYKAFNCKMDTFFVLQMKFLSKINLYKAGTGTTTIST